MLYCMVDGFLRIIAPDTSATVDICDENDHVLIAKSVTVVYNLSIIFIPGGKKC